jgi:hypothetical protein
MTIGETEFSVRQEGVQWKLLVAARPYGHEMTVTREDLARLSRWASAEATRLAVEEAERSATTKKETGP